jgi:hypothetical protein
LFSQSVSKHGRHRQFIFLIGNFFLNLLWNCLRKWTETCCKASMKCRWWRFLISSRSVNKHGRHRQFLLLIRKFLKIFFSETACPNKLEIGRKHIYKVLYKDCPFSFDPLKNMVATGNSCFWLVNFYESSPLNLPAQNELKFDRKHLWKVLYINCSFHPDPFANMTTTCKSCFWLVDFYTKLLF